MSTQLNHSLLGRPLPLRLCRALGVDRSLRRRRHFAAVALLLAGRVGGGGPDAGFDGGFPDAPVVSLPVSRIIDESGDLGLLMEVRLPPGMTSHGELLYSSVEVTTHDLATEELVWVDTEEEVDGVLRLLLQGTTQTDMVIQMWFNTSTNIIETAWPRQLR